MDLRGDIALVTGAGGFVGSHTARRLAEMEVMRVRALLRSPNGKTVMPLHHPNIELVQGDVLDSTSLIAVSPGVKLVVHAAMSTRLTTRKRAWATAVEGTRNVYEAALRAGVQRFIFMSSFSVYFGVSCSYYDEETPLVYCGDLYADAKITAEEFLRAAPTDGPTIIILRPPIIYGPGSWFWSIRLLKVARQGRLFLPGGGKFPIAYTYIENMVDAIIAAAKASVSGGVYNIFDGHILYRDFVTPYARMTGTSPQHLPLWGLRAIAAGVEIPLRLAGWWMALSRRSIEFFTTGQGWSPMSAEKAKRDLKWIPNVDFERGMQCTQMWLRQNGYLD